MENVKLATGLKKVPERCQKRKKDEKKQLQCDREPRGVALTCVQGIALGARDEEGLHVQQIKSRTDSVLGTDVKEE